MAIVRIDFAQHGWPEDFAQHVATAINITMQQVLHVPQKENFVICTSHHPDRLFHYPEYVAAERLKKIIFIQITLNQGRPPELKAEFFACLTRELCVATALRSEDIFINLIEVARENWSFGQPAP